MDKIFLKNKFPQAPGGDLYEWTDAETNFTIAQKGLHLIKITASAKNVSQNTKNDDDDLRVALDGYHFGKYEIHSEKISWKAFGTSASWDGASLKGGTKTIYFFVNLEKGDHKLQFFADMTPELKTIEVTKIPNNLFELSKLKPAENINNDKKGVPWMSFIFLGLEAKSVGLGVNVKSAKSKKTKDGDNLKVVVNGKIQKNPYASISSKYKNFYFSGDIKEFDVLMIDKTSLLEPIDFEQSIELWYDQTPEIDHLNIKFFDTEKFVNELQTAGNLSVYFSFLVFRINLYFKTTGQSYASKFLSHAHQPSPKNLIFKANHPIADKIKNDPCYKQIITKIKEKTSLGILNGELWPNDFPNNEINFTSHDLANSVHGIKKINYIAKVKKNNHYDVDIVLYDIYDFKEDKVPSFLRDPIKYLKQVSINKVVIGQELNFINTFEVEINLKDQIR